MSEEKKSYIKCKCGATAYKLYDPIQVQKDYPDNPRMQMLMLSQYQCSNQECSRIFTVSLVDVTKAFITKKLEEGETTSSILDELKKVKNKIKRDR